MKKLLAGLAPALLLAVTTARAEDFSAWTNRMTIAFNGYAGKETLADFPALIRFTPDAAGRMKPDGSDLRFADFDGNPLAHEMDTWNPATDEYLVWVRVPVFNSAARVTAYFGNGDAGAPENAANTWAANFLVVQHFNDPDGATVYDATAANRLATIRNHTNNVGRGAGMVGRAVDFTGTGVDSGVQLNNALAIAPDYSLSAWFMGLQTSGHRTLFRGNPQNHHLLMNNTAGYDLGVWQGEWRGAGTTLEPYTNVWTHVMAIGTGNTTTFYVNGAPHGQAPAKIVENLQGIGFNQQDLGTQRFADFLDEVRVASGVRSPDWIKAEHDTVANPAFAHCGPPEDNDTPLFGFGAANIAWNAADLVLSVSEPVATGVRFYWGGEDGEWDDDALAPYDTASFFSINAANLQPETTYWARYALVDNVGAEVLCEIPLKFTTAPYPKPVLGAVTFEFSPAVTNATVEVVELGAGVNTLSFHYWETGAAATNTVTLAAQSGPNTFALPGALRGRAYAWRAELAAGGLSDSSEGEFTVRHTYTWVGPATGNQLWNVEDNWDAGRVPNEAGAIVEFPTNFRPNVDIAGVGPALTLGSLTQRGTGGDTWYQTITLSSGDDTPIVWDNLGEPVRINWFSQNFWGNFIITARQVFTAETHVRTTTTGAGNNATLIFSAASLSGPGPITCDGTYFAVGAAAGATNLVTVPFQYESPHGEQRIFWVNGPGAVHLLGTTNHVSCGNAWGRLVGTGCAFLLSGSRMTTGGTQYDPRFFNGQNSALLHVADGSFLDVTAYNPTRFGGYNNTVLVSGPGSTLRFSGGMDGNNNRFISRDGGLASIHAGLNVSEYANHVIVSGADPAMPGVFNLNGNTLAVSGTSGNALDLQPGGVVTNGHVTINDTGRLQLAGGNCVAPAHTLTLNDGGALAPVLSPALRDATDFPVKVGAAVFNPGAKITPVYDTPVFGVFKLVEAGNEIAVENITIDAPGNVIWKPVLSGDKKQLSLLCASPRTLFLLK